MTTASTATKNVIKSLDIPQRILQKDFMLKITTVWETENFRAKAFTAPDVISVSAGGLIEKRVRLTEGAETWVPVYSDSERVAALYELTESLLQGTVKIKP